MLRRIVADEDPRQQQARRKCESPLTNDRLKPAKPGLEKKDC